MEETSKDAGRERRRSGNRSVVDCTVRIKPRDRSFFESEMCDLSATGFQVNSPAQLEVGASILVGIPGPYCKTGPLNRRAYRLAASIAALCALAFST